MEHPEHFVSPQSYKLGGGGEAGRGSQQEALSHSGQVTQVEDVVEAGGSGGQLLYDVVVQIQSQACQASCRACFQHAWHMNMYHTKPYRQLFSCWH